MKQKVSVPFMLLGILFNVCLIAANLLETKVIQVFGITVTAGLLVFPISYIINESAVSPTTVDQMARAEKLRPLLASFMRLIT
jgi:uncharacterized PurR-regulated membrane protein YhhQ (DUF165 family)